MAHIQFLYQQNFLTFNLDTYLESKHEPTNVISLN